MDFLSFSILISSLEVGMEESTGELLVGAMSCGQVLSVSLAKGSSSSSAGAWGWQGLTQPACCSPGLPWLSATSMEVVSPLLTSETFSTFSPQGSTWVMSQKSRVWISAVTFTKETLGNEAMESEDDEEPRR